MTAIATVNVTENVSANVNVKVADVNQKGIVIEIVIVNGNASGQSHLIGVLATSGRMGFGGHEYSTEYCVVK